MSLTCRRCFRAGAVILPGWLFCGAHALDEMSHRGHPHGAAAGTASSVPVPASVGGSLPASEPAPLEVPA